MIFTNKYQYANKRMKVNLNSYALDSQTYLLHLYDNIHINHCEYDKYIMLQENKCNHHYADLIKICDDNNIDIYPYIYTLDRITLLEKKAFNMFYITYMKKNDMVPKDEDYNIDVLLIATRSLENLLTFIITIQYFFL
jgi:hypothetical protein